ncbi:MAG: hypothetical protein J7M40_16140, partial [Planctomycetes bacterium]|nr:hypothetical protein [Planctomycetota bacterium]
MEQSFFVFNRVDVTVGPEEVLKQSGYPRADSAGAGFRKRVEVELTEVLRLIEPKGAYLLVDGARRMGLELFAGAEKVVLALATIGPAIETRARTLVKDQQGAGALIVDAVGTIAAEKTADFIEDRIREHFTLAVSKGLNTWRVVKSVVCPEKFIELCHNTLHFFHGMFLSFLLVVFSFLSDLAGSLIRGIRVGCRLK